MDELIDDMYAAAFLPSLWPRALERLTLLSGGMGTALLAFDGPAIRWLSTPLGVPVMEEFVAGGWTRHNERAVRDIALQYPGFLSNTDMFSLAEIEADPLHRDFLRPRGLGWNFGTTVAAPTGETIALNTEFLFDQGPVPRETVERMNPARPHFARAALMSTRLRLEQAQTATRTLESLGLPAAVINAQGRVLSTNPLLEALAPRVETGLRDHLTLAHKPAQAMLAQGLAEIGRAMAPVRSIPIPATAGASPLIVHLIPVRGEAHDLFANATAILVVTPVATADAPSPILLRGLFDLTPSEAEVARGLMHGGSIQSIADTSGRSRETVRHHLKSVLAKTGTSRQADLVALLSGAHIGG